MKKKLLVIGNKIGSPQYNDCNIPLGLYKDTIDSMDYVCRINRMHNYDITTGTKVDGLYLGGWDDFVNLYKGGEHVELIKHVPNIYIDSRAWVNGFAKTCDKFITELQKKGATICTFEEQKKHIGYDYPCSVILMIDYFATTKPWCDEYEVWITGIDIADREEVLKSEWQWKGNGHHEGATAEHMYLHKMINEGKVKWLEQELYKQHVVKHVPILIPIKSKSMRCPYKNEVLLPYTLDYLDKIQRLQDAVIISDGDCYRYLAKLCNVQYYVEDRPCDGDEFTAILSYLNAHPEVKEFVWLPVTQPVRDDRLVDKVLDIDSTELVTSYIQRQDRTIYKLNDDNSFLVKQTCRKGSMCGTEKIADGAIYYMKTSFFNYVYEAEDRNKAFWNSEIRFVENEAPLVDIDSKNDLLLFLKYYG